MAFLLWLQIGSSESCIMSSCVKPLIQSETSPVVLLHCFDRFEITCKLCHGYNVFHLLSLIDYFVLSSSCLEWSSTYPLLEEAGLEAWAIDVLGWGFCDLGSFISLCSCFFIPILSYRIFFNSLSFIMLLVLERLPPCNVVSKRCHLYQVLPIYHVINLLLFDFANVVSFCVLVYLTTPLQDLQKLYIYLTTPLKDLQKLYKFIETPTLVYP